MGERIGARVLGAQREERWDLGMWDRVLVGGGHGGRWLDPRASEAPDSYSFSSNQAGVEVTYVGDGNRNAKCKLLVRSLPISTNCTPEHNS